MRSPHWWSSGPGTRGALGAARLVVLAVSCWAANSGAMPWRPVDDSVVLAEVPAHGVNAALEEAEREHRARPDDPVAAGRLVTEQLAAGRRLADPRYFGQAQAVLERFRARPDRPIGLDLQWADILQHRHDYDAARRVLDEVLARAPDTRQARLMRAQMNLAQGRLGDARRDCAALLRSGPVGTACLAQVIGMAGDLGRGYALLARSASADGGDPAVRSWILTGLADMAARRGDPASLTWLERAVSVDPDDQYAQIVLVYA
jgi:predicted Zn-dependent protease